LTKMRIFDENTVLPAVPLWFETMTAERAQSEIDHLGSSHIATDWGARIISDQSRLYDPLSYHNGSVWPLFTGWASMGAYRYGRPHVGYQALTANALLTFTGALGYVTELLSGDFNAPFSRSSHHQLWSEAMVITPAVRGLLGIEARAGGKELRFAPQLPASWNEIEARNVPIGDAHFDVKLRREVRRLTVTIRKREVLTGKRAIRVERIIVAPAFPLDARIRAVKVGGRSTKSAINIIGDVQRAEVTLEADQPAIDVVYSYDEGTDVFADQDIPVPGAQSKGLRILRSRADRDALHLVLEGLGGRSYRLNVRTPHQIGEVSGVLKETGGANATRLLIAFDGPTDTYVRRELSIPLRHSKR
jgi:hypothetical protein